MANNPREIGWHDSSDSDEGEDMEEVQENLAYQNFPTEPRPAHAPIVSLEPSFVQANRVFWEKCVVRVVGRVKRYYVLHFGMEEDRQQILNEGPWAMQGGLLTMFPWEPNLVLSNLLVTEVAIWVQLWNLPLEYQTPLMAEKIGSLMREVREIDWAPTFPRNLCFLRVRIHIRIHTPLLMGVILQTDVGDHLWIQCRYERVFRLCRGCGRIGYLPHDCDRSREQVDASLDQEGSAFNLAEELLISELYTQDKASNTDLVVLTPINFFFDPWVPLDANGNMNPPSQVEIEDTETQGTSDQLPEHVLETQPKFDLHEVQFPLPGIRINETRSPDDRDQASLNWIEFTPSEYGLATGWPLEGNMAPIFEELSPIQHDPTATEIEELWKEIYAAQEEPTTYERFFETSESSRARAQEKTQPEEGMRESMKGGTLTFLPPRLPPVPEEGENNHHNHTPNNHEMSRAAPALQDNANAENLQLNLEMAWNGSGITIMEPQPQLGSGDSSDESTDPNQSLTIIGADQEGGELQPHNSHNLVIMANHTSSDSAGSSPNEENAHHKRNHLEVPQEGASRKRKRPFEMELIEQFVKKKGNIGSFRLTLTLKAPKQRKRKAIQIEEIEEACNDRAKKQKTSTTRQNAEIMQSAPTPDIAEVFFTGVYGAPVQNEREVLWKHLMDLNIQTDPWIITGDFNQVANLQEKMSQCPNIPGSEDLNNTVNQLGLMDLQTVGNWYMWTNGRQGSDLITLLSLSTQRKGTIPLIENSLNLKLCGFNTLSYKKLSILLGKSRPQALWPPNYRIRFERIQHHHQRNEELIARKKLEFLLKCEEIKWAQRAKHLWLLKGDRNTKYFHNIVKHHRMRSRINRIQLSNGQCTEDQAAIKGAAKDYFTQLYSSTDICDDAARNSFISNSGIPKLTPDHVRHLSQPFTKMEIEDALFQMDGNKAPGPDGMSPMFFQHCWEIVQQDVNRTVGSFLSRGHILRTLNQTHIALIPKVDSPQGFKDYRPISLCNTTYKIISKVLTNRLQTVFPDLITPFQNAFVKGRLIQDNILVASELLHYIKGCKKTKGGWAALKVDLHKAYDKLSWAFLREVLNYMNFPQSWQLLLMQCVTTATMKVKINGELTDWIIPQASLRQGDPLSPYLFVLCANVLSNYLMQAQTSKSIKGIKIARNAPTINHLMYADDILMFLEKIGTPAIL
ncbi:reverse transcriptase [Senna tora]|uniref:Reverse transcriptase n=1 Tax=Senna tora TaxID=362788 RepID=A0A834STW9_9FABA|nr:reverse transcriptase [Senna tora]